MDLAQRTANAAVLIAQKLGLIRPLVFWDLETTGLKIGEDRIVEFCFTKVHPDGSTETFESLVAPGIPIPKEASDVHKITNEIADQYPEFGYFVDRIEKFIYDCDLCTFNGNKFDFPFLMAEFMRNLKLLDFTKFKMVDASTIYIRQNARTLGAAFKQYTGETLEEAHVASADVDATICILAEQLQQHDIPTTVEELHYYSRYDNRTYIDINGRFVVGPDGFAMFNFGKYKGLRARDFRDYLQYIMGDTFPPDVKAVAQAIFNREIQ